MSQTRDKILSVASELFRKQGYYATTLNQISSVSQTPRGSIYYYFPEGKEQLANEAVIRTGKIIKDRILASFSKSAPVAELFYNHVLAMADELHNSKGKANIFSLISISREISESSDLLLKTCKKVYDSWIDCFYSELITANYSQEEAKNLAIVFQSMIEGAYAFVVSHQDANAMYVVANHIKKLLNTK